MKTNAIEVHDMLSVLSVDEVEKRIGEVPGVESVTVNFAAGNATVRYDETRLEATDIKSAVRQRGHEGHEGHAAPKAASESAKTAVPTGAPGARTTSGVADAAPPHQATPSTTPDAPPAAPATAPAGDAQPDKAAVERS